MKNGVHSAHQPRMDVVKRDGFWRAAFPSILRNTKKSDVLYECVCVCKYMYMCGYIFHEQHFHPYCENSRHQKLCVCMYMKNPSMACADIYAHIGASHSVCMYVCMYACLSLGLWFSVSCAPINTAEASKTHLFMNAYVCLSVCLSPWLWVSVSSHQYGRGIQNTFVHKCVYEHINNTCLCGYGFW